MLNVHVYTCLHHIAWWMALNEAQMKSWSSLFLEIIILVADGPHHKGIYSTDTKRDEMRKWL